MYRRQMCNQNEQEKMSILPALQNVGVYGLHHTDNLSDIFLAGICAIL